MDIVGKKKRSEMMSNIKGKNTLPEIMVRKYLYSNGYRYRIHDVKLPGKPDIVIKNKTVVAVEAIEGTDKALERGCELSRGKCVAVKVSRTNQDYRYDVPGIGPQTLESLVNGGASVLALEAGRVMVFSQSKVVEMADRANMSIVCI